jgi:hypothetical protein
MELKEEAVRAVLMSIKNCTKESNDGIIKPFNYTSAIEKIEESKDYSKAELYYAFELLYKEKMYLNIIGNPSYDHNGNLNCLKLRGLTISGHELCKSLENPSVFQVVKEKAKKAGGFGIKTIASTCTAVATALMNDPNSINNLVEGVKNITEMVNK